MLTDKQKKLRRGGLGGSDIAAVLGINPYKSAYQVYLEKAEGIEIDLTNNQNVRWGNALESVIADQYSVQTGLAVQEVETKKHKDFPFLLANPDRIVFDSNGNPIKGLEIKTGDTRQSKAWGPTGSKKIPDIYYPQIMHYMLVTELTEWDVAVLLGGNDFRIYTFERDSEMEEIILERGTYFWEKYVVTKTPPPNIIYTPGDVDYIRKLYDKVLEERVEFDDSYTEWRDIYLDAKKEEKKCKELIATAQSNILSAMKNANMGVFPDGSYFTRKVIKTRGYTVEPREYVTFNYRGVKDDDRPSIEQLE